MNALCYEEKAFLNCTSSGEKRF